MYLNNQSCVREYIHLHVDWSDCLSIVRELHPKWLKSFCTWILNKLLAKNKNSANNVGFWTTLTIIKKYYQPGLAEMTSIYIYYVKGSVCYNCLDCTPVTMRYALQLKFSPTLASFYFEWYKILWSPTQLPSIILLVSNSRLNILF